MNAKCRTVLAPPSVLRVQLCHLLLISLLAASASLDAWPVECGSDDCSRTVAINVSLSDPFLTYRVPVVQSSMPLAYNIVVDGLGRAFVGSLDGSFTSLRLSTGAVLWTVALGFGPLSSAAAVYIAPAASQGVLVMGRNGDVAMLRADTGSVVWSLSLRLPTDAAPIVSGIFAYIGSRDGTFVKLSAATGQQVWSVQAALLHTSARGATVVTPPVLSARGLVLFGLNNGLIMAINSGTAALMWRAFCLSPISGIAATPSSNRIIVTSTDGYVYSFDPSNGLRLWRNKRFNALDTAPAVSALHGGMVLAVGSDGMVAAMTISSGFTVWTTQLASAPTSGPIQSSNGALVVPCKNAVEVLNSETGSSAWSTSITPANQVGGVAVVAAEGSGATIVMTAFDGSLILLKSSRETLPLVTQSAPATSFAAQQPLNSSTPTAAANQTNSSTAIKPPVAAVTAAPPSTPPTPPAQAATAPFLGYELAVALSASAFAVVLGLAAAPLLHKLWLLRSKAHVRERKLALSLDKAAQAAKQLQMAEQGQRNARIDDWLTNQDLPRALPVLKPLVRAPASVGAASAVNSLVTETELKGSRDSQQTKSTAMRIGALPHSQWHVQRGFTRGNSFATRDGLSTAQSSPAIRPAMPPTLPPLPSLAYNTAPLKK